MNALLALAQIDPVLGDPEKNIALHCEYADRAIAAGAQMVVFPELSLTGYTIRDMNWDLAVRPDAPPSMFKPLIEKSRSIPIIAGGVEEGASFGIYNAAFLFENGTMRVVHRKTYPPTYGMFEEMRYFSRGQSVRAFDSPIGRIGVLVCEDLWHVSLPYLLAMDGAELIISLTASPTRLGGDKETLHAQLVNGENHKAYARLLSVYLAFCNRVGFEDGVNFWGGSQIVGPSGDVLSTGPVFDAGLVLARVDDGEIRRARRFSRHIVDEDPGLVARELERIMKAGRA
jgi:NAD+ synthase (glutamine-hydrolysing)